MLHKPDFLAFNKDLYNEVEKSEELENVAQETSENCVPPFLESVTLLLNALHLELRHSRDITVDEAKQANNAAKERKALVAHSFSIALCKP